MKRPASCLALCLVALAYLSLGEANAAPAPARKVIYYGWNTRDSLYVRQHWAEMEQMPFDGIGIGIALDRTRPTTGNGSTGNLLGWQVFGPRAFSLGSFQQAIADLRVPAWQRFTDNFLPLAIATRDQDQGLTWFDDARWATIENNWRVLLAIAREGRCRGLLLDPEQYDYECELFNYEQHRAQRVDRSFAEYENQARLRGQQLGAAVREIFPEITIGLLYGYSIGPSRNGAASARAAARYALWPAFLDGLIEGAAPGAKFVDLWEGGHGYKKRDEFFRARNAIQTAGETASGNAAAYAAAVSAGMSLRIDHPQGSKTWQAKYPDQNYFSPKAFETALHHACDASDRYVWIYSEENPQFFPPANLPAEYLQAMRGGRQRARPVPSGRYLPLCLGLVSAAALGLWLPLQRGRRRSCAGAGSIRLLIVTGIFPPDRGGPASYVPEIAAALTRRGHEVAVICLSDSRERSDSQRAYIVQRISRRQVWPLRVLATTLAIWRAARSCDVVYVNGLGFESAIAALLAGRPTVHKVVGDYAWERAVGRGWFRGTIDEYQTARKGLRLRLADFVRTFPLRRAEQIIVPSNYLHRIVSGWGIPAEKILVIHNAIAQRSGDTPVASKSGKRLITVCRLVPWKGVDALIRLLCDLPDTQLVVVGDGHLRAELEALARELGVASRVVFLGNVPREAVRTHLAQADAFVLNSTYEGLPHVILEAFAAGTPVIATDAGGTSEVVQHEVTGLLVRPGDSRALKAAIERLWADDELRTRLVADAGALLRARFDFEAMLAATEATLRGVTSRKSERNSIPAEASS